MTSPAGTLSPVGSFFAGTVRERKGVLMRFFKKAGMLIYMVLMLGAGCVMLLVAARVISPGQVDKAVDVLQGDANYQIALMVAGAIFVIVGILSPWRMSKKLKTDRVISFRNPDGEVSVSLVAIEEYIKKIAQGIQGIRDIKTRVDVNKRGIDIVTAVSLTSGSNIPEVTERIQMEVRNRVQAMLGVEENINIKMHINKIARMTEQEPSPREEEREDSFVPYREMD